MMPVKTKRFAPAALLFLALTLAMALPAAADEEKTLPLYQTGLRLDYLTRTFSSGGEEPANTTLKAFLVGIGEDMYFPGGWNFSVCAGLSLASFNGLTFADLPVSVEYQAGLQPGLFLGASALKILSRMDEFQLDVSARVRSSLGLKKTWQMTELAVPGSSSGSNFWVEGALGPRFVYNYFGRFSPWISVAGTYFVGQYKMSEKIGESGELTGAQKSTLKGKSFIEGRVGADFRVSPRLTVHGEAGFRPYRGGVDSLASLSFFYDF
jgi:hypothetical protein